jgi:FKBP-type peptidyl-prolyl cis-trans isomerase
MSEAKPTPQDQLLLEISGIINKMMPDITEKAKLGIENAMKTLLSGGLESEKKVQTKALSDILDAKTKAIEALHKELKEAEEEIAAKTKDTATAYKDAMSDWLKAMSQPKLAAGIELIPELLKHIDDIVASGKKLKARQDITVSAPKLISALLGLAITVMTLVVLIMQVFGK